jgi:DNA ligase D
MPDNAITVPVSGQDIRVSNPDKIYFPESKKTKLDIVEYYLAVHESIVRALLNRPTVLKRFPNGIHEAPFFQKRVSHPPDWLNTVTITFPSGRSAEELCPTDIAHVIWAVNLGCIDFNPWAVRKADVDHPDELRVDLDPQPGMPFDGVRLVAQAVHEVFDELGMQGFPKTSGNRGMHIYVRIEPKWDFKDVRRAALALGREIERRMPQYATTKWWKEERGEKVFIDYNQNARDRTVASAYSIRPNADAMVSCPLEWHEVLDVDPHDLTIDTVPARLKERGDSSSSIDNQAFSLEPLLEWVERDEKQGEGDAPWPPNFAKQEGEPPRVQPSRKKKS